MERMTSGYAHVEGAGTPQFDITHTVGVVPDGITMDYRHDRDGCCHHCGRCPHCGRGNYDYHPPAYDYPPYPNGNRVVWC